MKDVQFLDHVAIKVFDIQKSAAWYQKVLGLEIYQPEEWQPFPIMVQAGNSGIAIFPGRDKLNEQEREILQNHFHFAFRVSSEELQKFKTEFDLLGIAFSEEDHIYFKSIYFRDPDGYKVELTAPVAQKNVS